MSKNIPPTVSEKICPFMGVVPVAGGSSIQTAGVKPPGLGVPQAQLMAQPCVRERCSLWDSTHNQCSFLTKSQNIEQLSDVVFKLIKKIDEKLGK